MKIWIARNEVDVQDYVLSFSQPIESYWRGKLVWDRRVAGADINAKAFEFDCPIRLGPGECKCFELVEVKNGAQ